MASITAIIIFYLALAFVGFSLGIIGAFLWWMYKSRKITKQLLPTLPQEKIDNAKQLEKEVENARREEEARFKAIDRSGKSKVAKPFYEGTFKQTPEPVIPREVKPRSDLLEHGNTGLLEPVFKYPEKPKPGDSQFERRTQPNRNIVKPAIRKFKPI